MLTVLWFSEVLLLVTVRRRVGDPVDAVLDIFGDLDGGDGCIFKKITSLQQLILFCDISSFRKMLSVVGLDALGKSRGKGEGEGEEEEERK